MSDSSTRTADTQRADWRERLGALAGPTPLWQDLAPNRSDVSSGALTMRRLPLSDDDRTRLSAAASAAGVATDEVVLALWALLLARHSAESDVVFGVAHSRAPGGLLLVPARVELERPFAALARDVRDARDAAITDWAPGAPSALSIVVLADDDRRADPIALARRTGSPLTLVALGAAPGLFLVTDDARFDAWTAERLIERFVTATRHLAADAEQRVAAVSILDAAERRTVLETWNDTFVRDHADATVHAAFEEQVDRTPDAPAVLSESGTLSYAELDARANQLAHFLRAAGVGVDTPVAMCLERSADTAVVTLAILKAGGVYVPLEPSYPRERLAFMLRDAQAALLLTERALSDVLPDDIAPVVLLDESRERIAAEPRTRPAAGAGPRNRAYVMYTSGSTGTPKGVEITHRSITRLVCGAWFARLGPDATVLHAAPLAFDASTFEIWGALLTGGRLAMHPERVPTPEGVGRAVADFGVTTMWLTAGLFNTIVDEAPEQLRGVRQLLTGGEALSVPHIRRAYALLGDVELINGYGPTETTTFAATHAIPRDLPADLRSIPIGRPIRETRLYVLDAQRAPVPVGVIGELYIGGEGLAIGYLGRADLTAERFLADPFTGDSSGRMYKTGDLVRWLRDGTVEYLGRADNQVKISGYRIELGEIEAVLSQHPAVRQSVVIARDTAPGAPKQLVAYLLPAEGAEAPSPHVMRTTLRETLPGYMVPAAFVWMSSFPLTGNGKVDHRALPAPELRDRDASADYAAPRNDTERAIAETWCELLGVERVGLFDNVFDLGANSLLVVRARARLQAGHGIAIPVVRFFQHPTVAALAESLTDRAAGGARAKPRTPVRRGTPSDVREPIAIVGMAARLPGADDVAAYWRNLVGGVESISYFAEDELDTSIDAALRADPSYVRARGVLRDADRFDAGFFGMSPREAQLLDPQQRVFLEIAWEALESAGHVPETYDGVVGVWAGVYNNSYASTVLSRRPDLIEQYGAFNAMLLIEKDYVATRAAFKLGLTGPALNVFTACSTSLVAVCQAVASLRGGECDMALAGGVAITVPVQSGYLYQEGSMLSPDGHTRTFDARANGTVFSDGAAVVALKRLSDAQRDGNPIYAVIRGVGVNNDGGHKASFTAPSVEGQAGVIRMAHEDAGVDPRTISYVEAHGTATPLGDPIEFEALVDAFRDGTSDTQFCAIGSAKSNIGHTVMAAGGAGLIKTALSLTHEVLPPSLHFDAPNASIDFARSPFRVNSALTPWPRVGTPRRAAVSSFGVGGTNAHVVIEEAPLPAPTTAGRPAQLLTLSARSAAALDAATANLARFLDERPDADLADVAYTLSVGRRTFAHRRTVACATPAEAVRALAPVDERKVTTRQAPPVAPPVYFMFPGQGAQYVRMGAELYRDEPEFRAAMDRCAEILQPVLGRDLREMLFAPESEERAAEELRQTSITQPALFSIEYALAQLWLSWGVTPRAMIGHSVGEFVAATVAGVMPLEDALRLIGLRGRMMQEMPAGSMLSVRLPSAAVLPRLGDDLAIASDNGPSLCVVSGPTPRIEALQRELEAEGVMCRPLHTSHAFHSAMMEPVVEPFAELLRGVPLSEPRIPFVSSVTGAWITPVQARDPMYWARHLRETVLFGDAMRTLLSESGHMLLLEVGPRTTLATLARQQIADKTAQICVSSLADAPDAEWATLLGAVGQLWTAGVAPDWRAIWSGQTRRRVALPTYPFERQRYWADQKPEVSVAPTVAAVAAPEAPWGLAQFPASHDVGSVAAATPPASVGASSFDGSYVAPSWPFHPAPWWPPVPSWPAFPTPVDGYWPPASEPVAAALTVASPYVETATGLALPEGDIRHEHGVAPSDPHSAAPPMSISTPPSSRKDRLSDDLRDKLADVSGIDVGPDETTASFVELGFDSLILTQVALALQKAYGVKITFRELIEEHATLERLAAHLDQTLPPEATPLTEPIPSPTPTPAAPAPSTAPAPAAVSPAAPAAAAGMPYAAPMPYPAQPQYPPQPPYPMPMGYGAPQPYGMPMPYGMPPYGAMPAPYGMPMPPYGAPMPYWAPVPYGMPMPYPGMPSPQAMPPQSAAPMPPAPMPAAPAPSAAAPAPAPAPVATPAAAQPSTNGNGAAAPQPAAGEPEQVQMGPSREFYDAKKAFGAAPRITITKTDEFTPKQRAKLDAFIRRYNARTKESKRFTQEHRGRMADPRAVTGFRPQTKELVYPLVIKHSSGSRMWDLDGNEYVDVLSGFGSNMFGWGPEWIRDAVKAQLDSGYEIGPQHPLAGEVTDLFCEYTGHDRCGFCNTGSEAVLGAMRIARTVTGRSTIVIFSGSYHGINDEVLVRGTKKLRAIPAAPGILPSTAENVLVLDYGTEESLNIIRERASEIAAVMVEPVQSRRPDFQPAEFLRAVRQITTEAGAAFIWDEIVTGFRAAPGGAQEHFGIKADIATYGKVVGGGLSIGVIAGKKEWLDALDGGPWQFGDGSVPEVGVTYFAGTFVRHPLALAAAKAVLLYLKARGPALQRELTERTQRLAAELNAFFQSVGVPLKLKHFSSVWKTFYDSDVHNVDLLFYMLRDRGIHIYDGFPCFMTTAHTDEDVSRIVKAFKESVAELQEAGFLPKAAETNGGALDASTPPVPGARLGRDRDGTPAWFVENPEAPGKFVKVRSA
jgi:amino acid adenylation domain-containing protein